MDREKGGNHIFCSSFRENKIVVKYVGTDSYCQRYDLYPLAVSRHSRGEFCCLAVDKYNQWWREKWEFECLVLDRNSPRMTRCQRIAYSQCTDAQVRVLFWDFIFRITWPREGVIVRVVRSLRRTFDNGKILGLVLGYFFRLWTLCLFPNSLRLGINCFPVWISKK